MRQRKLVLLTTMVVVLSLSHWCWIHEFVVQSHLDQAARWVQAEFLPGATVTILLALVWLLPNRSEDL